MASTLFEEDVVLRTHRGKPQLGLVVRNYDGYNSVDDSEDEEETIKKGYARVAWYPKGREDVVPESKVKLYDRSLMPGDAVRRNEEESQRGIVRSVHVACHLHVIRTKQMIYDVCSQDFENIMMFSPNCHVVMGSWIGVVRSINVQLIVRLKNGARCALPDDSACRLTDIHDTSEDVSVFSCDSFYPGQVLRGPATTFKSATWLSGQQPILSSKANFTVTVEEVNVVELDVHWQTRGLCRYPAGDCTDSNQLQPPPRKVTQNMLPSVKPLSYFIAASIQIGDKVMYRVKPDDLCYPTPVPRGSHECNAKPSKEEGSAESSAGKGAECSSKVSVPQQDVPSEKKSRECELSASSEQGQRRGSVEENKSCASSDQKLKPSVIMERLENHFQCINNLLLTGQDNQILAEHRSCSSSKHWPKEHVSDPKGADLILQEAPTPHVPGSEAIGMNNNISDGACEETSKAAPEKVLQGHQENLTLEDCDATNNSGSDKRVKKGESTTQKPPQDMDKDKEELLARAEVLKVGLSRDVDLLGELHQELCDASESVTDIAKNFRTLLQRASNESAREISGQVSRLLESQGKLQQQIQMTEGLLVDSKKSLRELDDIEMETRGTALGKPSAGKNIKKARGPAGKNWKKKFDDDKDADDSTDEEDEDFSDESENSDASSQTDSNASSKGESRRHKVVSSLLQRHTKKQHIRLAPKRRPPPKPLEAGEKVCVEVTHTRTLVDVMWQDGTLEKGVVSTDLFPVHQLDELEFFPGDFVTKNNEDLENVYGLVWRTDHKERTCLIQWIMRPNQQCTVPKHVNSEEVSVYELTPHPDFTFNVGDVIVRIADSQHGITTMKKGKPDPKGTNSSTQTGDSNTQMVNYVSQISQPGDCTEDHSTHVGDASTHVGISYTLVDIHGNQMGNPGTNVDFAGVEFGSQDTQKNTSSDNVRTSDDAQVKNQDAQVEEPINRADKSVNMEAYIPKRGESHLSENNHFPTEKLLNANNSQTQSLNTSLRETQQDNSTVHIDHATVVPVTEQGRQIDERVMDQQGAYEMSDANRVNVDRMNMSNLKTGLVEATGGMGTSAQENHSAAEIKIGHETQEVVPCAGQVRWINTNGEIHVAWVDGSECSVLPQDLYKLEEDSDSDWSDNGLDGDDWKYSDQSEEASDSSTSSWETASDASGSAEDINIISPPSRHKDSIPSPSTDAPPSETKTSETCPQCLDETTVEQTLSALSLVEDKMRRINSCADSILEKRTGLSHQSPEADPEDRKGVPGEGQKQEAAAGCIAQFDESRVTRENMDTSKASAEPEIPALSQSNVGSSENDLEKEDAKPFSPTSTSPTEIAAASEEDNLEEEVSSSSHDDQQTCPKSPTEGSVKAAAEQACDNFFLMEEITETHHFNSPSLAFLPEDPKHFSLTMKREMRLLQTSLPQGIRVKGFADRMDLFSVLFEGPSNTPYEDGLFFFDGRLPQDYPKSPPIMHYHAYSSGRLNPNLYNDGKVCVSLLGTWTGRGSEMWTSKSNLLQVLVSIQGLILVDEPYYNEAGYEKHRGSQPGMENSRLYNETALLKMVQSMTLMLTNPPEVFHEETINFCRNHGYRMIKRIEYWISIAGVSPGGREPGKGNQEALGMPAFPLLPLSKGFILSTRQALRAYRAALGVAGIPDS